MIRALNTASVFVAATLMCVALGTAASAETLVVGTGNAAFDVPAVQAAVDTGGVVKLRGRFSFDTPPIDGRTILVSGAVEIVGVPDGNGQMPTIEDGTVAFRVNAPGLPVAFHGLQFADAKGSAIEIRAATGVSIDHCTVDGVEAVFAPAIGAPVANAFLLGFFTPGQIVGNITISNNRLNVGGSASERTEAIAVIAVGRVDSPADVLIRYNDVRNVSARGIDLRNVIGQATIERNTVSMGAIGGQQVPLADRFVDGIRVLGAGVYRIRHNTLEAGFENAAGIRLQGTPTIAIVDAVVESNEITMAPADGAMFGMESAGIEVRRAAAGNVVLHNRVRGRARAAIALIAEAGRNPQDTFFLGNEISNFISSAADVLIGSGVVNTTIIGSYGTVDDQGVGTVLKGLR